MAEPYPLDVLDLGPAGDCAPAFAFSAHKSGSTLLRNMIHDLCQASATPAADLPGVFFSHGIHLDRWQDDARLAGIFMQGRVYYGFRLLPRVLLEPNVALGERRTVLLVRDPRDALVSQFYSFGTRKPSHKRPASDTGVYLRALPDELAEDIDEYVLHFAPVLHAKLDAYRRHLNFKLALVRRYEDVYYDKRTFLAEIAVHLGITRITGEQLDAIAARHDVRPTHEDATQHIRKGEPGDHVCKLRRDTIELLNQRFQELCEHFGYDLGRAPSCTR